MSDFGFEPAVLEIVAPVLAGFGLAVEEAGPEKVRFGSDLVWAVVFLEDDRFRAIVFRFGRRKHPSLRGYGVSDAVRLVDRVAAARCPDDQAHTAEAVRFGLERLARNIERYCVEALRGEVDVFEAMDRERELYSRQYSAWTRIPMGAAVSEGRWDRVVEIYESAEQALNILEQRTLEVARQNARTQRASSSEAREDLEFRRAMGRAYRAYLPQDGSDVDYRNLELAVGDAMDVGDWRRVVELYESYSGELEDLQQRRLVIAREKLGSAASDT